MRTLVLGDIHGRFEALQDVLQKCKFDPDKDRLIVLGDVVDGYGKTKQCVDELLKAKHLILLIGNHDVWFRDWFRKGLAPLIWTSQGGQATIKSYGGDWRSVPDTHKKLFEDAKPYFIDEELRAFVHGGFDPDKPIGSQPEEELTWDRALINTAMTQDVPFRHVFVGHTTTQLLGRYFEVKDCLEPVTLHNLTMMDTGAGFSGRLTILDVDTFEFWQSDKKGEEKGR